MRKLKLLLLGGLLLSAQLLLAQPREVTGKVTDASGAPISGATIKIRNQKGGTVASPDGTFKISAASNAVLIVSAIGYEEKEVNSGTGNSVYVQLVQDTRAMSEVVVTGTGAATTKRKLAISVESISAEKLPATPTASVDQALVGKIAGAQISSVNGNPGSEAQILLRGINTLRSGTTPMILLDGIEVKATELNSLDLVSIERIEVIQGAAAATLYGAQGANGVIQLFSKKGRSGKINIDVSSSISRNSLLNIGDVHKAYNHSLVTNANNEVLDGSGNPLVFDLDYSHYAENVVWNSLDPANSNVKPYDKNLLYYDHYKMFFQTATTYNNSISISGSRDKVDFNISGSDSRQESVFRGNGKYDRSNFVSNIGIELAKNLKMRAITQLIYTHNTLMDQTGRTIFYALNNSRPFANYDYKSPDGNYGAYFGDAVGVNGYNPNYQFQYGHPDNHRFDVLQTFNLNYKFLKFFEADVKYGLNYQNDYTRYQIDAQDNNLNADYWQYWLEFYSPRYSAGSPTTNTETGEINDQIYRTTFHNFIPSMTVRLDLDKDFHLKLPIKSTTYGAFDYRKSLSRAYVAYGLDAPPFTPYTAQNMLTYKIVTDTKTPFNTYGYLFDQKFEYGEIGGVSGGFRTDYSSAFGRGSKPFTFPHFNGYLRLSSFNFWNKGKIGNTFTELKLRGAFGKAGIQPGPFDRYVTLTPQSMGDNVAFVFKTTNPNPDLSVEVSRETEIGTDMTIKGFKTNWFKNFNFSFSYWDRKTDNAIWPTDAAPSTGVGSLIDNAFGLESHGYQASLNISAYSSRKINWNFTTNFSNQTSEISFVKDKPIVLISNAGSSGYVLEAGKKVGQLFGYLMLHSVDQVDPKTGQPFIAKADQPDFSVASNGWVVYSNPAKPNYKQPYVTPNQYSFGDPNPKFNMSFINDVTFGGWISLSMQWDWVYKSHLYNQTKEWMYRDGIHGDYDKAITVGNETGAWTAFYRGVYAQVSRNGTKNYFYETSSFGRLRNLSLAVDFSRFIKVSGIHKVQLVLTGRNIATITKYTGMDPEISSGSTNSAWDRGVDHNSIPNIKSYQVGINLGF
jgi:TonB-dependent starch-binding outer membrane protein SusC